MRKMCAHTFSNLTCTRTPPNRENKIYIFGAILRTTVNDSTTTIGTPTHNDEHVRAMHRKGEEKKMNGRFDTKQMKMVGASGANTLLSHH